MKILATLLFLAVLVTLPGCMVGKSQMKTNVKPVTDAYPSWSQVKLEYSAETPLLKFALERVLIERFQVKDLLPSSKDTLPGTTERPSIVVRHTDGKFSRWGTLSAGLSLFSFAIIPGFAEREDTIEIALTANGNDIAKQSYNLTYSSFSWLPLALFEPNFWFFFVSGAETNDRNTVETYEAVFTRFITDASPRMFRPEGGVNQ